MGGHADVVARLEISTAEEATRAPLANFGRKVLKGLRRKSEGSR